MIGKTFAHYRVTEKLGAGGMGEVYRATDTKLGRDVAVKILPEAIAADPQRMARFQREAHILASMNHASIATIHGLEDFGAAQALVMELVEGETLADRIGRGAVPLDEALPIARQIAEALEYAHEHGIIHRDLKPANVKLAPDGRVKILDFGLAKALDDDDAVSPRGAIDSPTVTAMTTEAGIILGTAAYMSPEQARGKAIDRRADIWSFGVVLFEMLTGRAMFAGDTVTDVLAAVVRAEPDWSALPKETPPGVRRALTRALEKDPHRRLRDIGDARLELEEANSREGALDAQVPELKTPARKTLVLLSTAGIVLAALAAGAAAAWYLKPEPPAPAPVHVAIMPPADHVASGREQNRLSLSPDGNTLVYVANRRLYVRRMDSLQPVEVPGSEEAFAPFFSPDGEWIGFLTGGLVKKVSLRGGAPVTVSALEGGIGADWGPDGTILLGGGFSGILKVRADGGRPEVLVKPKTGFAYIRPHFLPGGREFLYVRYPPGASAFGSEIIQRSLEQDDASLVLKAGGNVKYLPSGHLIHSRGDELLAVPFDPSARKTRGNSVVVAHGIDYLPLAVSTQFDVSRTGVLAYVPGSATGVGSLHLVTVDRSGKSSNLPIEVRDYSDPRISPDGRLVALHLSDEKNDVWVADPARGALTRLSFDPHEDETPAWSPDGRWIAWSGSREGGRRGIFRRAADGSGPEELLWSLDNHTHVQDWSPDGRALVLDIMDPSTNFDIWTLSLGEKPAALVYLQTKFNERSARVSPDGRWLAYVSDESGRDEVYVQAFPSPGSRVQVSTGGGQQPVWSRDGRALMFRGGESIREVSFAGESPPRVSQPRVLFADTFESPQGVNHTGYDVWADGRFLMVQSPEKSENATPVRSDIILVLNWVEELKSKVR